MSNPTYARVTRTTPLSIPAGTDTAMSFDTADFDNDHLWDGTGKLIVPDAGVYVAWSAANFSHVADTTRRLLAYRRQGVGPFLWQDSRAGISSGALDTAITTDGPMRFNAGDSLELLVRHDSPSAPRTVTGRMEIIGPVASLTFSALPVAWVHRTTVPQNVAANVTTPLTFETVDQDDLGMFNGTSDFIIPDDLGGGPGSNVPAGYLLWGRAAVAHVQDSTRRLLAFRIVRNGVAQPVQWQDSRAGINSASLDTQLRTSGLVRAIPGDHVQLVFRHESASAPRPVNDAEFFLLAPTALQLPWP